MVKSSTNNRTLTSIDKFSLVTGMIGLFADAIALITFAIQILNLQSNGQPITEASIPSSSGLFVIFLTLIYSWFALGWTFEVRPSFWT